MEISVKVNGGLFTKNVTQVNRNAVMEEAVRKISTRWMRGGRGKGVRNNTLREVPSDAALESRVYSTLNQPRTTGSSMTKKKIGQAKAMAPRVLRKYAERVVKELDG